MNKLGMNELFGFRVGDLVRTPTGEGQIIFINSLNGHQAPFDVRMLNTGRFDGSRYVPVHVRRYPADKLEQIVKPNVEPSATGVACECQTEVMKLRERLEDLEYTVNHIVGQVGCGDGRRFTSSSPQGMGRRSSDWTKFALCCRRPMRLTPQPKSISVGAPSTPSKPLLKSRNGSKRS